MKQLVTRSRKKTLSYRLCETWDLYLFQLACLYSAYPHVIMNFVLWICHLIFNRRLIRAAITITLGLLRINLHQGSMDWGSLKRWSLLIDNPPFFSFSVVTPEIIKIIELFKTIFGRLLVWTYEREREREAEFYSLSDCLMLFFPNSLRN